MPTIKNFKHRIELDNDLNKETAREAEVEVKKEGAQAEKSQERKFDSVRMGQEPNLDEQADGQETAGFTAARGAAQKQKEREKKIENILSKDIEEIYLNMPANKQWEFKRAGEQTAKDINGLLEKTKVKVNKVIGLIKKWLSIIPGVNKFFLEQESKIKADEIIKIKK